MKLNKMILTVAMASLLTPNIYATEEIDVAVVKDNNNTVVGGIAVAREVNATDTTTKTAPVVGSAIVDVAVTEVYATGYRASKILHSHVYNKKGERIGKIDDFIIGSEKDVTFAIIAVGGFLGLGEKLVAVPAVLLEKNDKKQLVLPNAEKDDLKALPEFKFNK